MMDIALCYHATTEVMESSISQRRGTVLLKMLILKTVINREGDTSLSRAFA